MCSGPIWSRGEVRGERASERGVVRSRWLEEPPLNAEMLGWTGHTTAAVEVSSLGAANSSSDSARDLAFQIAAQCMRAMQQAPGTRESTLQSPVQFGHLNSPRTRCRRCARGPEMPYVVPRRERLAASPTLSLLRALLSCSSCSMRHNYTPIEGPRAGRSLEGRQRNNREAGPILVCVGPASAVQERRAGSRSDHGRRGLLKAVGAHQSSVGVGSHH